MFSTYTKKHRRTNRRLSAVVLLALVLALAAVAPPSGQAAEVAPAVIGTSATETFENGTAITWPDITVGDASPSNISVSGLPNTITKVTVTLANINHSRADDLDVLLQGPNGNSVLIMSDACGDAVSGLTVTFDDDATGQLADTGPCTSNTYQPSNFSSTPRIDEDDQPGGITATHATLGPAFNGSDPNGTWTLYALDDRDSYTGSIDNGWSLTITTPDVNQSPSIDPIPDDAKNVGENWTVTANASDPEGDTLAYSVSSSAPGVATASVDGAGIISLEALAVGTTVITVTVNDGNNPDVTTDFTVTVLAEGEPTPEPTEEPTAEPTEEVVVYTAEDHRRAQAPLCMDLSGQTNPAVRAAVPGDAVPDGNVYCRVLAEGGVFPNPNDPGRVGDPGLIEYGVITAVDIFGVTEGGLSYPAFNHAVTVCLEGSGRFIFLNSLNSPRTTFELPAVADGGYTCASIPAAGTVVLIPFAPQN